jgi:D-serine deaminase-like pyridoxal phosphate-dependent protein
MPSDLPQLDTPCLVVDRTKVAGNAARLAARLDRRPIPDLIVVDAHQEHGITAHRSGGKAPDLPVGTRLRILPNHACATGGRHAGYSVTDSGREVAASWTRFAGW